MKIFVTFALFISTCSFGQSVTITPSTNANNSIIELKKDGTGLNHRSLDNLIGIGTFVTNTSAWIQTHTNHPLRFTTNSGNTQLILATNGNFGIGNITPIQRLHVDGNANVTGTTVTDGLVSANTLSIGGGNTISKFLKVYLTGQTIPGLSGNFCGSITYNVTGVSANNTVILNIESTFTTPYHVASVIPKENAIEVKYCNVSTSSVNVSSSGNLRITIIK